VKSARAGSLPIAAGNTLLPKETASARGYRLRPPFNRMLGGQRASDSSSLTCEGRHWFLKDSCRHFIARRLCQLLGLFLLMPLSCGERRRPSRCCQQQVGSQRFDISLSRYLEPSRTRKLLTEGLDRQFWPVQPRRKVQRMREQRSSLGELFSLCFTGCRASSILDTGASKVSPECSLGVALWFKNFMESEQY